MPNRRPPYQAALRVYEPIAELPVAQRERWAEYAQQQGSMDDLDAQIFAQTVQRLAAHPPALIPRIESDLARLLLDEDQTYVSLVQPRLAVWQWLAGRGPDGAAAGEGWGQVLPPELVPTALRDQAVSELESYRLAGGETRLFSRTVAWEVPVAWFVPFRAKERQLALHPRRSLTYRTSMAAGRRRSAVALRTAQEVLGDIELVQDIEHISQWLEEFHPRSRVELDYGGLVDLLDDVHLQSDDSASDVSEGMAALAEGDATSAAAAYRRWTRRWQRVQLLARSS